MSDETLILGRRVTERELTRAGVAVPIDWQGYPRLSKQRLAISANVVEIRRTSIRMSVYAR